MTMYTPPLISPLAIAPMIDWTYSHFRVFMRLLLPKALLYTEMQTQGAVLHNPSRALEHFAMEYPLALQLGGSDPKQLALCAKMGEEAGYQEINLNLGCPSDKVQAGQFGACLMAQSDLVKACISAMQEAVSIPVTAKIRLGIDQQDSYAFFSDFAHQLVAAGAKKIIVHARKAWLQGLNPKQNRTIPPVHYPSVYRLQEEIPTIPVVVNGNITQLAEVEEHRRHVPGVMLGRLACDHPYALTAIHALFYPDCPLLSRAEVLASYLEHVQEQAEKGISLGILLKPVFNLVNGLPGASSWRREMSFLVQSKSLNGITRFVDALDPILS